MDSDDKSDVWHYLIGFVIGVILAIYSVFMLDIDISVTSYFNSILTENISLDPYQSDISKLCSSKQTTSKLTINRGLWVILPYNACIISYDQQNTLYNWHDELPGDREKGYIRSISSWNRSNESDPLSVNRSVINVNTTRSTNSLIQYCDGNGPFYDENGKFYTVYYLPQSQCYYHMYSAQEQDQCFSKHKSIFFLGDSTMEELAFIIMNESKWIPMPNKHKYGSCRHYVNNQTDEYELMYCFFPPSRKTGVGMNGFSDKNTRTDLKEILLENKPNVLVFNSLLHDMVRQGWEYTHTPAVYYDLLHEFWLFLFIECDINMLFLWTGINPAYLGRYKNLIFYYEIYLRTFINAVNDFIDLYPKYKQNIEWIDTAHISDGHRNDHYTDGIHYGLHPNMYGLNTSIVVELMTSHIVFNQLCPFQTYKRQQTTSLLNTTEIMQDKV